MPRRTPVDHRPTLHATLIRRDGTLHLVLREGSVRQAHATGRWLRSDVTRPARR